MELPSTPRLHLRRLRPDDLPGMVAYRSDPAVARYQTWSAAWSLADAEQLLRTDEAIEVGTRGAWTQIALRRRDDDALVGDIALCFLAAQPSTVELGVTLSPRHQRQGFAAEALRAAIDWLFTTHGIHRVLANVDDRNHAARRVFEQLGLRLEARLVEADWFKGEWTTLCTYAVLAREWPATQPG